jgi:hypothetical protein
VGGNWEDDCLRDQEGREGVVMVINGIYPMLES